jgi:hypothetical protein
MPKVDFSRPELIGVGKVYKFLSESRDDLVHYVVDGPGGVICTCEGWQYRQHCKHVDRVPYERKPVQRVEVTEDNWWKVYDEIIALAEYLYEHEDYNAMRLMHFIEKPWNYTEQWKQMKEG